YDPHPYIYFSLYAPTPLQSVHSFPTRRSSDLALAVLQGAFAAMGGSVPSDSTANGTVTTVAGSQTESGSVIILTRGTDQTSEQIDRKSTRLNSSHQIISYAVFCLKKKKIKNYT